MTTLLVIDIGNTNVSLGLFDYGDEKRGQLAHHWRIGTHRGQTSDRVGPTLSTPSTESTFNATATSN